MDLTKATLTKATLTEATWRKSSHSTDNGGDCVELAAAAPGIVAIRDSKNPEGPVLLVTPATLHQAIATATT
ncbi:DUF397 domain-containing protein [Actinomadura adrarensis]|uniref:DUF397 domain-containing protein n=1 Tax=Actinomadura adrarensis TaxID=1819600 RepID=A0ABW3CPV0_9ACTN